MAYFGGKFDVIPNGVGPGARINVKSKERVDINSSTRGIVAAPIKLDWGLDGDVKIFTAKDFAQNSLAKFGYELGDERLRDVSEIFRHATKLIAFRLNGTGDKATSGIAEAKYSGIRGNDIVVSVEGDPDAGTTIHDLAEATAAFSAEEDRLTVTYSIPEGYTPSVEIKLGEEILPKSDYSVTEGDSSLEIAFNPNVATGNYSVGLYAKYRNSLSLISTATVAIKHTDAVEAVIKLTKGTESKGSGLAAELNDLSISFTTTDNSITATYDNLPEGYTVLGQLMLGAAVASTMAGRIDVSQTANSITYTFGKEAPTKAEYTFRAKVAKGSDKPIAASCTFNLALEGEDVPEFVTATFKSKKDTDWNIEVPARYIVKTYLDDLEVNRQRVKSVDYLKDNDYVVWNRNVPLQETAGTHLEGGTNSEVTVGRYAEALNAFESQFFNVLVCPSNDEQIKEMYKNFTIRLRDELGIKFQTVMAKTDEHPNHEAIIQIENYVLDDVAEPESALTYWVGGLQAGCEVYESAANVDYDGVYNINLNYSQRDLEYIIEDGYFAFHQARGDDYELHTRTLLDINTLVEPSKEQNEDWSRNQTIRVIDEAANYIAALFNNRYFGKVSDRQAGREQLANDIIQYFQSLETKGAIDGFDPNTVTVEQGPTKRIVIVQAAITPVNALEQMYMTIIVD